jgi:aerobic-type carbon monoxide dehydrogenase small subunit (CoxS/CutS family)
MARITELEVNGARRQVNADPEENLLGVLREQLDLTGPKYGCGEGQCRACTVLVDGRPRHSCILPVGVAAGKRITTIEGLEREGRLHPVQQAFLDEQAFQCGYCTPGMILTASALLNAHPDPSEQEIARFMEGNICRCGVYPRIIAAVRRAARLMRDSGA